MWIIRVALVVPNLSHSSCCIADPDRRTVGYPSKRPRIFPNLNIPVIAVRVAIHRAHPEGMEGRSPRCTTRSDDTWSLTSAHRIHHDQLPGDRQSILRPRGEPDPKTANAQFTAKTSITQPILAQLPRAFIRADHPFTHRACRLFSFSFRGRG